MAYINFIGFNPIFKLRAYQALRFQEVHVIRLGLNEPCEVHYRFAPIHRSCDTSSDSLSLSEVLDRRIANEGVHSGLFEMAFYETYYIHSFKF
jgi:hypothetical protein